MTAFEHLGASRVIAVVPKVAPSRAPSLAAALVRGGLEMLEVTLRADGAIDALLAIATDGPAEVVLGAGTVLTRSQVDVAVAAGATYIVSPGYSAPVVRRCRDLGVPCIPGVATATEVMSALDDGATVLKFFPAQAGGGPALLRSLAAVFPNVRWIPTGGITRESMAEWLQLPEVIAVGGSWMIAPPDDEGVERLAREAVAAAAERRGPGQ